MTEETELDRDVEFLSATAFSNTKLFARFSPHSSVLTLQRLAVRDFSSNSFSKAKSIIKKERKKKQKKEKKTHVRTHARTHTRTHTHTHN